MNRIGLGLRLLAALTALAGCGGGGDGTPDPAAPQSRPTGVASITATGGRVDGEGGASVTLPSGALDEAVQVTIAKDASEAAALPPGLVAAGAAFTIQPHDRTFAEPVEVRLPFDATALPADSRVAIAKAAPGAAWRLIEDVRVDGGFVVARVQEFSILIPVFVPLPRPLSVVPPASSVPEFRVVSLDATMPSEPLAGEAGRLYLQGSTARPRFRIEVNLPAAGGLARVCSSATLNVYAGPARRYRLAADAAGTSRLGGFNPVRVPVASAPLAFGSPQVLDFEVAASDEMFNDALGPLPAGALPYGAPFPNTDDATGVSVEVDCPLLTVPNVVPRFGVAAGFAAGTTARGPVSSPRSVEATALDPVLFRAVVFRTTTPADERWLRTAASGATTPLSGIGVTTPTGYVVNKQAKGGFTAFELRLTSARAEDRDSRYWLRVSAPPPGILAVSEEAQLSFPAGVPPAQLLSEPGDVLLSPGMSHSVGVRFRVTPMPRDILWQIRPRPEAPWEPLVDSISGTRYGFRVTSRPPVRALSRNVGYAFIERPLSAPLTLADDGLQFRAVINTAGGRTESRIATLRVSTGDVAPSITLQPVDVLVAEGSPVTLTAAAGGTAPLSYQWYFNGRAIAGGNRPTLPFTAVNAGNSGDYQLEVMNREGRQLSRVARLAVTGGAPAPVPPTITTQPASLTVPAGSSAGFTVAVAGAASPSYRWQRNGTDLPGATAAVLTLPGVAEADAGEYAVVVSAGGASVTSQVARLNVGPGAAPSAPAIVTQPTGLGINVGQTATLAVAATGTGPLIYQWQRGGTDIPGATAAVLVIADARTTDAGDYTVTVVNASGRVTSGAATLVVVPNPGRPEITLQPAPISGLVGGSARFSAAVSGSPAPLCLWLRNGIVVPGATDCTGFTTPTLVATDDGAVYNLFAYSTGGYVFGTGAVLTVRAGTPPVIVTQPVAPTWGRGDIVLTVEASGTPVPAIDWAVDRERIGAGGRYAVGGCSFDFSTSGGTLTLSGVAEACIGSSFQALATNAVGRAESDVVLLTAPGPLATRIAGLPGTRGSADGGPDAARFNTPNYLTAAADGRIAVGDFGNSTIRLVSTGGEVGTLAGTAGVFGFADGTGTAARFAGNGGVAFDRAGNLFVCDWDNHVIRRITPAGVVSTVAGSPGLPGSADGSGSAARFRNPNGLAIDAADNLYVVDWGNHTIRHVTPAGEVITFAGRAGVPGSADGVGAEARFNTPGAVAIDAAGHLVVSDMFNHTIRRITPAGAVSTLAGVPGVAGTLDGGGSAARFDTPAWIAASSDGLVFVVSAAGDTVRRISPDGVVTTVVGVAGENSELRLGIDPRLRNARGVWAVSGRELLIAADQALIRVRLP